MPRGVLFPILGTDCGAPTSHPAQHNTAQAEGVRRAGCNGVVKATQATVKAGHVHRTGHRLALPRPTMEEAESHHPLPTMKAQEQQDLHPHPHCPPRTQPLGPLGPRARSAQLRHHSSHHHHHHHHPCHWHRDPSPLHHPWELCWHWCPCWCWQPRHWHSTHPRPPHSSPVLHWSGAPWSLALGPAGP